MAGHYFYDPRPFYGHNGNNGLMPLDELFYGRYEPVPYWMDQRMAPVSAFDDYYPGHKQMAMGRPLPQLQQYAYKRPESRDDIGVDMYRRSPYNFQGVAAPMGYGGQQQRQSQDDTWVHAMTPHGHGQQHGNMTRNGNGNDQYRQMEVPMGYMPNGNMNGSRGMEMPMNNGHMSNKGNNMSNMGNSGNHGSQGNKQMNVSSNQLGNKSNGFGNKSNGFGNGSNAYGNGNNGYNGYENVKSSSHGGHGGKSMNSKQGGNTKQRYAQDDSSSDDSDDEYENGNNNGVKWATKNSVKHGSGHQNFTQKTGSKGNNYGYDSISSQHMSSKKSGGHGGGKSGGNHGSNQSKISKLLRFQDGDSSSSDSEDEGYGHSKKSSKGSSKMSNHGSHGSFQNHGHQQQSKQMQYGSSQSKGVELKVPICCDNCERKVKECLEYMDGVENVLCDQWNRKVIVYGNVKPENVLKRVRRVKKTAELWQQAKQHQQLRAY